MVNVDRLNESIEKFAGALDKISSLDGIYESILNTGDTEKEILEQTERIVDDQKKVPQKLEEYFKFVEGKIDSIDQAINNGIKENFDSVDRRINSMDLDMKARNDQMEDHLKEGLKDFERSQDRIKSRMNGLETAQEEMSRNLEKQIQELKDIRSNLNNLLESSQKEIEIQSKMIEDLEAQSQEVNRLKESQDTLLKNLDKIVSDLSFQKKIQIANLIGVIGLIGMTIYSLAI